MTTIVLCGDSYYDFDNRYPGLHWADRLSPHNVYRLARGGASNFSIWHQVQHATKFSPDIIFLSFTSCPRVEFPKLTERKSVVTDTVYLEDRQWHYCNNTYDNVDHALPGYNNVKLLEWMPYYIEEYEVLKNFLFIKSTLDFLKEIGIRYYFTLGEFNSNIGTVTGIDVNFPDHAKYNILPNGWKHPDKKSNPYFHIADEQWHANHANLVKSLI